MKIVFVGGGSHRYLSVARSVLAMRPLLERGEINVYDPAAERAEAVGRMIMKSPECAVAECRISWGTTLDEALDGADVVMVVLMAGGRKNHGLCETISRAHGFIGSDQLSPSGAVLALKGGPILMDIATRMERLCPDAWLIDFANPVAVLSAAVNNHTSIRCLGVCAGYTNHQWDLTRVLYGRDEQWPDYEIHSAGVNHLSFILHGSRHRQRDLYDLAAERITPRWCAPPLSQRWSEGMKASISGSVQTLVHLYRKYGWLVFSTEGDGLLHLDMDRYFSTTTAAIMPSQKSLDAQDALDVAARVESDRQFDAWIGRDIDDRTWNTPDPNSLYLLRDDQDIMVKVISALGGHAETAIASSYPNNGAVQGFKDRTVLEYSQLISRNGIHAAGRFDVPDVFQGLISALATHQTLLGDAIATRDPRMLFDALYNYPVKPDTTRAKEMWCALIDAAAPLIPREFGHTKQLLRV
jgi:alpha-galactosidase/6-phospho-beta-glucosidase family protein